LLRCDARVRFLSCEPLLGPVDLTPWIHRPGFKPIDWVIAGGESGPGARPMHPDWVDGILDTCRKAKIPFHFKQWGNWAPATGTLQSRKKTLIEIAKERPVEMIRLPKKEAGRILAGRT